MNEPDADRARRDELESQRKQWEASMAEWEDRWTGFLERNRDRLSGLGLPEIYWDDTDHWVDFMEHGGLHYSSGDPGWHLASLSQDDARILLALMIECLGPDAEDEWRGYGAIRILKIMLGQEREISDLYYKDDK